MLSIKDQERTKNNTGGGSYEKTVGILCSDNFMSGNYGVRKQS